MGMGITLTPYPQEVRNTITISPFVVNCTVVPYNLNGKGNENWYGTDKVYLEQIGESNSFFLATPLSILINPIVRATGLLISLILFITMCATKKKMKSKTIKNRFR